MHLCHNFIHFSGSKGPARSRVDIAHRSQMQNGGGCRFVIRGFQDEEAVVVAQRPVNFFDFSTQLLGLGLEDSRPLGRVVNVFNALLAELDVCDESCHRSVSIEKGIVT